MSNKKIIKIKDLVTKLSKLNKKIGLCHGVFDLLHLGHINHFNEAKRNCDILIVSVTQDKYVSKGPGRPVFNQKQRMEALSNLVSIDFVVLSDEQSAVQIINSIKPNLYFKGPDYKNSQDDITQKILIEKKYYIKIMENFLSLNQKSIAQALC